VRLVNHADLPPERLAGIEAELSGQKNLGDVLRWASAHPAGVFVPTIVAKVVVQDEFTHDVIIPWRDGLVLVYDTT
jgi:hypothetical protein